MSALARTRNLHIKSQNRTSGIAENFYVPLVTAIQNCTKVSLQFFQCPQTQYNITTFNNILPFTWQTTLQLQITIPPGCYTMCELLCSIQILMNTALGNPAGNLIRVSYEGDTFQVQFSAPSGAFQLNFTRSPSVNLSFVLGFQNIDYSSSPGTDTAGNASNIINAPNAPELWIPSFIYISVREFGAQIETTSQQADNPTFVVPIDVKCGEIILWKENENYDQSVYFGNQTFNGLNISLQTSNISTRPVVIDNHGSEWDMLLSFTTVDPYSGQILNSNTATIEGYGRGSY